ncbi:unnamed protein product [Paramecium sonneborni]|uniref:Uncharacterized protein n=1 Tax=Paramecium sonneborni TaxID=65129 RepID=A0A8S1R4W9_9CILI|nr:unnamed protein product [Paramecium sonneborni]
MQTNDKKESKSRILIELINNYQKPVQEKMLLEKSKLKSIQKIEERFIKSETNKQYVFPRKEEKEEEYKESPKQQQQLISLDNITNTKVFKELMNKIYQTNTSKQKPKNYQQTEFIKKQYFIQSQLIKNSNQKQQNQIKTEISDTKQNRQNNNSSLKQMSINQSRGQSPNNKLQYSNRSISSQMTKFLKQKKNCLIESQDQNSQRSFELKQQLLSKSQIKLQQNKSFDFLKQFYIMKQKK